ncbi:MAG: SDR family oxidoreductase [Gammaproteobacteria bacterium]|nr:SDR family oxidoreductase [Gammaproteobacteria bacterium]
MLSGCAGTTGAGAASDRELILVAGASGRVGRYVIGHLQQDDRAFRSLTRDEARAVERWGADFAGMNWVEGDVRDAQRMREVMRDVTHVICVVGSRDIKGPNSAEFVDYRGVANLVDAAVDERVEHFVLLTAIGTTDPKHPFNKATKGALEWRFKGEEHLRQSGLSYTIVRPAGLQDRPAGEQAVIIAQGDNWKPFLRSTLSRDDLSLALIESLQNPGARNATFEIANDPKQPANNWRALLTNLSPD